MPMTTALLLALVWTPAQAQQFDARGMQPPPDGADVRDAAYGFSGARTGAPVLSAGFESVTDLLVIQLRQGPNAVDNDIVNQLVGMNLALQTGIYGGFGLGVTMPLWFFSTGDNTGSGTLAPGDAGLWLPVEVVGGDKFSIGVVPLVKFPTGADARWLGDPGFTVGGIQSNRFDIGSFVATLDGGLDYGPPTNVPEWPGGLHYRYAAAFGVAPNDGFGFLGEMRGRAPLASDAPSLPNELLATLKFKGWARGWFTVSGGRAFTRGVGAPGFRLYTALHIAPGTKEIEEEIVVAPTMKELHLTDGRGYPISNAFVSAGGVTVNSDVEGHAVLPPRSVKDGQILIEHPHYETVEMDVNPEELFWQAKMIRKPVPFLASVVGPKGALAFTDVRLDGPYDPGPPEIDEAGVHVWYIRPGTWKVRMASPGLGTQERTIVISPDRTEQIRVDAVLTPLISENDNMVRVEVVDRLGRPVEDAVVALDDRDLGTTGTGGDLTVMGLKAGTSALTIRSDRFGDGAEIEVVVDESGEQTVKAVVDWRPGSVKVDAVDPFGQPIDANVTFVGPANLPARGTGSDGSEVFVVRPGLWNVEVSAPGLGTQVRTILVTGSAGEVAVVDVDFQKDEGGDANLGLAIRDVEGEPVENAVIKIDDQVIGSTSSTGELTLTNLIAGKRTVTVEGPGIMPVETELDLVSNALQKSDVMIYWDDGVADVSAVDKNGDPVDAIIQWTGPGEEQDTNLGGDGFERLQLTPGEWKVEVSAPGFTTLRETVVVEPGTGKRADINFKLVPEGEEADIVDFVRGRPRYLEIEVKGPDGKPIDAKVSLRAPDGTSPVNPEISVGGMADMEPPAGEYKMVVEAEGMRTQIIDVVVDDSGETQVAVQLDERQAGSGASVLLVAESERGDAIVDADVVVAGKVVGKTDSTGTWELTEVPEEGTEVTIVPTEESGQDAITIPVAIDKKDQRTDSEIRNTVVLPDKQQGLEVTVIDNMGNEVAAKVVAVQGSGEGQEIKTEETSDMVLEPGVWTVTAVTETGEMATAEVVVASGDARAARGSAESKIGADGKPIATITTDVGDQKITLKVEEIGSALTDGALVPVSPILFHSGRHDLREDAKPLLADLARWLNAHREASLVEVGGHTDDIGGVVYNQQLSERRANTVRQALIDNGVAQERLLARGYGLSRPITANVDDASRQRNRRVALVVLDWSN